jgi:hypothetical protein
MPEKWGISPENDPQNPRNEVPHFERRSTLRRLYDLAADYAASIWWFIKEQRPS